MAASARREIDHQVASGTGVPRSRKVLLLVDFINPLAFDGAEDIAEAAVDAARAAARLKKHFHHEGACVIYVNDNFGQWRSDVRTLLQECKRVGGAAAELARLLAPSKVDLMILKPRHSGFYATPLDLLLEQLGAKDLVITGLATDYCVKCTAMDAYVRGYRLAVPSDCTAAESQRRKEDALAWMKDVLKARVTASR
ncbi:Nicotinamidase-related amidase [Roseateles sp. YR242]|uniref:cysteine hydrolase family protein n=1 Tax=Roseateles sp. YR242 TaxID=1855305 RepID=UPI0008D3BA53|nr:isochorismatase family cysteine hydrolase [Roseateles sp. YR242]SEK66506.1 Nicotinamidase-related amidase [Roseateles sp. YR242]